MDGPRAVQEEEWPEFESFLNSNLRPEQNWSISEEYPLALHSDNLRNMRVIKENGRFVSGAVLKHLLVKTPAGIFRVGAIGSVVTSPDHRNQGYSRQVMDECLRLANEQGCDFAMLWTNLYDFYRKLGFELAGSEIALYIDRELPCEDQGLHFLNSNRVAAESIAKLYSTHTAGTLRTVGDIQKHLSIPNSRVYTAWDKSNQIQAYCIEGKGLDLVGYVHEWGGGVSKIIPLLNFMYKERGTPFTLIAPSHSKNLIQQLTNLGLSQHTGFLGMIKPLHVNNLLVKVKRYARGLGVDDFIFEKRDGFFYLGTPTNLFRTDSETDLVRIIFGPYKASQIHDFGKETLEVMEKIFPIPLWIWGWDSV